MRSDIDLRSQFCAVSVRELYNINDFCLTIKFFGNWSFRMAGNKCNLAFRELIIKDYKKGVKQKEIATKYSINKSIVCRIIMRFDQGGPLETERKSGRPHKICRFTDRKIIRHVKKNPFDSADTIQKLKLSVSENTVC